MIDIQSLKDTRNLDIDKVGVKGVTYPIILKDKRNGTQSTIAKINMSVNLPHNFKGTHMSRFLEVLNRHKDNISNMAVSNILDDIRQVLNSDESHLEITFPYFIEKEAPVSKISSIMDYECTSSY